MTYKVSVQFQDKNMPDVNINASTLQAAMADARRLQGTYAALRSVTILEPTFIKHVYNGAGVYQFTIPGEVFK